jgi:polyisoprenoid-binding protein YceI
MYSLRSITLFVTVCGVGFAADSSGKFTIYMSGKQIATETYSVRTADGKITIDGSAAADLGMLKINVEQFKVVTDDKYKPLEALDKEQMGKASRLVKATFTEDMAKAEVDTGQGPTTKEANIHGDDVVINPNLPIFPWSMLAPRVKLDTTEPQQFYAYVLGQAEAPLTVTSRGKETVEFANKTVSLSHISGSMSMPGDQKIAAEIWMDDDRRIIKAVVAAQNIEVYQEGFERKAPPVVKPPAP